MKTTSQHMKYWSNRKIDWDKDYLSTIDHPHRDLIIEELRRESFHTLFEIGCASGPNLLKITKHFPLVTVGGVDVNKEAIALARERVATDKNILDVGPAHDLFFSDKSIDVTLSDMCLIYYSPLMIKKVLKEIKRVTRYRLLLCEFHSANPFKRWGLRMGGYNAYNYPKLLEKMGFYDIYVRKIKPSEWPGGEPQKTFGYIISANL